METELLRYYEVIHGFYVWELSPGGEDKTFEIGQVIQGKQVSDNVGVVAGCIEDKLLRPLAHQIFF